ncbi:hypothetical protein HEK616_40490 [Streptomyces nigrescens]|uniref:Uncharacterized protein n=1 Tax=Streptomyces nigrescens TaxID=1920 RepID=A0ABM7ZW29_STRNI|nr:hypothetical protein HEK616_40490 [Streptomyces nigrescens]
MTYSPDHCTDATTLQLLADRLAADLAEMQRLMSICQEIQYTPGLRPDVDPDGTGRTATRGPGRPTEDIALNGARLRVQHELTTAQQHLTSVIALVRGVTAALDRALSQWEGEPPASHGGLIP